MEHLKSMHSKFLVMIKSNLLKNKFNLGFYADLALI